LFDFRSSRLANKDSTRAWKNPGGDEQHIGDDAGRCTNKLSPVHSEFRLYPAFTG
jgi:hypothetical protein